MLRATYVSAIVLLSPVLLAAQPDRIARPVDARQTVRLAHHVSPLAAPAYDRGPVDPALELDHVVLMFKPSAAQQADLDRLLADQQNPSSPNFHRWLTPEEYANRFGISPSDNSKVVAWLKSEGFTVEDQGRGRNWVAFRATAAQVTRSLHTPIHRFEVQGAQHFANTSDPAVPAALAGIAGGFLGLNDFNPKSGIRFASNPNYTSGATHYLAPEDFATIYDLNPLYEQGFDGTGQSIAIVGQCAASSFLGDIRGFRTRFGLPANDPKLVSYGADCSTSDGESNLDVEWAGAVAPKATIYYIHGTSAFTAMLYAVNNNVAPVISSSYGTCEDDASPLFFRSLAQQANAQGITILSAAGDGGAAGCFDQFAAFATHGPMQQFPASLPEVTAMGGTQFDEAGGTYWAAKNDARQGSALSYIPEKVWNESEPGIEIAAGAGGASTVFAKPAWQTGRGVPNDNARDVPDLALSSACHDGYFINYGGSIYIACGTSAAAPVMSGILAILNQYQVAQGYQKKAGLGNINPQIYRLAQTAPEAFHDIVDGDNMVPCAQGSPGCLTGSYGYKAAPAYDLATGWGSIDANSFITGWNAPAQPVTVSVAANPSPATLNDSVALTATVEPATGEGVPTGSVEFSTGATCSTCGPTSLGSAALSGGSATLTAPAWSVHSTVGAFTIYAQYSGDAAFSAGGGRTSLRVTAPSGVSAVVPTLSANPVAPVPDAQGLVWQVTISLREMGGVPSLVTGFTIDGQAQPLAQYFPSAAIPPNDTLNSAPLTFRNLPAPVTRVFGLTGVDSTGQTWTRQISADFLPSLTYSGGFNPTLVPLTMVQNPKAPADCQWSQQLFVDEITGDGTSSIAGLYRGGVNLSSQISAMFGATRLAAWNSLSGTLCWSGATPGASDTVEIDMDNGLSQIMQVSFTGPPASAVQLSAPESVTLSASTNLKATGTLALSLTDKTAPWTASIFPANRTTSWLTLAQLSGTGPAQIALQASGEGFEPGVYRATIVLQSPSAVPQTVNVPVMFVYGPQGAAQEIDAVGNAASYKTMASPGMLLTIYGSHLANTTDQANSTPLPFVLDGVSVAVNGLAAPILYISPTQINIQVPYEAGAGPAVLGVNNNGQIAGFQFEIAPAAPGIFADGNGFIAGASGAKPGGYATLYLTGAGDINSALPTGYAASTSTPAASLPKPLLPVSVTVAGQPAFLQFIGNTAGTVGVTQVNFLLPSGAATGTQPVVVTVGGVAGPPVNLTVTP